MSYFFSCWRNQCQFVSHSLKSSVVEKVFRPPQPHKLQVIASYSKYFLTSLQAALFKLWPNSRNWNLTSCFLGSFFFIRKSFNWLGMFNLPKSCTFNKTPHFLSFQKSIQDSNQHWKLTSKKIVVQNTCYNSSTCRSYVPCPDDRDPGRGRFF